MSVLNSCFCEVTCNDLSGRIDAFFSPWCTSQSRRRFKSRRFHTSGQLSVRMTSTVRRFSLSLGENYWVFDAERQIRGPESIRSLGLSVSGIQAALRWGHEPEYHTYLFKSGSYWRFSPQQNRVESVSPRSMSDWTGIPDDVDAAFRDHYGMQTDG